MNLLEQIKAAQGSRGRLEAIFLKLAASSDTSFSAPDLDGAVKAALVPLAQALLACGAFAQVLDLVELAASQGPIEPVLSAFAGTAAANLGLAQQAIERLRAAAAALSVDSAPALAEEVYGTLGRLYKQRALEREGLRERAHDFELSLKAYREAYRVSEGIWSGVNVATLSMLLERKVEAQSLARTLSAQIDTMAVQLSETLPQKQWRHAVRGEAALLQNDLGTAAEHYAIAASIAQDAFRFGEATSMRRQARLILQAQRRSPDLADLWMPAPMVVTFTGHRLDESAAEPRFPLNALANVRERLHERLSNRQIRIAFCSLSEGADILFAQAALDAGLELNIVLPNDRIALKSAWLDQGLGSYAEVVEPILAGASKVYELAPEGPTGTAIDYLYANEILLGSAILRAQECEGNLRGLAVWDRLPARGMGGTATMVASMLDLGLAVELIDPLNASLRQMQGTPTRRGMESSKVSPNGDTGKQLAPCGHQMRALLFGDFVGFSKLSTLDTIEFSERVLPDLANVIDGFEATGKPIAVRNTWGDGLFLVLEDALDAALLALEIQACVSMLASNLRFPLKMRIALHYAPVLLMTDAISRRPNAVGPGVSRAARLEPATAPGSVYASEALATQLALCRYPNTPRYSFLKHLPWAKGYGVYPTYLIEDHVGNQHSGNWHSIVNPHC